MPKLNPTDRRVSSARSPRFVHPATDDEWTAGLAYAVGLIATDGCLGSDRKTVTQTSKDLDLLETFRRCIGTTSPIRWNERAYRVQVTDVGFYRWLESTGLTQRKSLTLGPITVPSRLFAHLTRGLLDGDGSIISTTVVPNPRRYPLHTYPRLLAQFLSASEAHITWLREQLSDRYGLAGWITCRKREDRAPLYTLRYSKHAAITLLSELYRDSSAPRLERKWRIWSEYAMSRPTRIWTNRRSGVTGSLEGFKIPWTQVRVGSNPTSGTVTSG